MKFISARSFKLISNSTNGDSWIGFVPGGPSLH
jgi:hypothetical protein